MDRVFPDLIAEDHKVEFADIQEIDPTATP